MAIKTEESSEDETTAGAEAEAEKKAKAEKAAKAKAAKVNLEDPAVKKAIDKAAKEAEARGRKAAADEAKKVAEDAKLSEAERLRNAKEEAENATKAAEKRALDAEAREALRDVMDDLEVKPAGPVARASIVAAFSAARTEDPAADPAKIIAEIQKSDAYLFVGTKAAAKTTDAAEGDSEAKAAARKATTEARGGKTPTTHKAAEKPSDEGVIDINSRDPRKIREQLAKISTRT